MRRHQLTLERLAGMTSAVPLLCYSNRHCRAQLLDSSSPSSMPSRRPGRRSRSSRKSGKKTSVRIVKGRVNLRVSGYTGIQRLGAGALLQYIPRNKIQAAAKKYLKKSGVKPKRKTRRTRTSRRK